MPFQDLTNLGAQTTVVNPLPTNVSTKNLHTLLYPGNTTRIMLEYQPWFCNTSNPCNGHKVNGMEESNAAQILEQAQYMKSIGGDVATVDYYGCASSCGQSATQAYNLAVTTALANVIAANPTNTPTLEIMIDGGSFDALSGVGQCAPAAGDQSACIIAAINLQMDYLAKNWLYTSYYETNAANCNPIVLLFIGWGSWPDTSPTTVYAGIAAHAMAGNTCGTSCTYINSVDIVDENAGAITAAGLAGGYGWVQPLAWSSSNQLCWRGSNCGAGYLASFYSTARAHLTKLGMGVGYKGFDDTNAGWGSNRVLAQQCGQVLIFTANQVGNSGYSSSSQLQYWQIATWNDYEEATEVETGIDNCFTVSTPTLVTGNLNWSMIISSIYADLSTVDSFSIYTGTGFPSTLYASGIAPNVNTFTAPTLTAGQSVWIYMVGKPLMQNRLSGALSYTSGGGSTGQINGATITGAIVR